MDITKCAVIPLNMHFQDLRVQYEYFLKKKK